MPTVHTSGINWESVGVIISGTSIILGFILAVLTRYVTSQITSAIDKFRIEVVDKLETRITVLETIRARRRRLMGDTYSLIKPFTGKVNAAGNAVATVTHSLNGLAWEVVQIGVSLGLAASSPQVAAHVNGIPLVSSALMSTSVFSSIPGAAPIAMTTEFSGPPYPVLEAGDQLVVGVIGATPGDTLTVGAYINEIPSPATQSAITGRLNNTATSGYIPRAGRGRWARW